MTKKIIINEKLSDEKKKRLVALFGADRSEDEEEVQVKTTSPTAAATPAPKEQPKKAPVDKKPQVVAKPKLTPTEKPEIKPADKKDKTAAIEPERKPLEIPKPDWLPERIDNAFRELALVDGKGTPFTQTGTEKELGDPTGQAGQASATGAIEGNKELTAIAQLLNKANYPQPCYEYIKQRFDSLDDLIVPATPLAVYLFYSKGGAAATAMAGKYTIKGIAKGLKSLPGPAKTIGKLTLAGLGAFAAYRGVKSYDDLVEIFKTINISDAALGLVGIDRDEVDPECVLWVNGVIAGVAALLTWVISSQAILAFFKKGTTSVAKLAPKLKEVFLRGFYSSIIRQAEDTQKIVLDIVRKAPVENKDVLKQLPDDTKGLIDELPDLLMTGSKQKPLTSKEVQELIYDTLDDPNDPIQRELADRLINNVFNKLDPAYNTAKINAYKRAERSATRAAKQADDVARELRGQAGFGFDEVAELSGQGLNRTGRLINKAFDANNTTEAARLLDDVVQTARSRGFLKISPLRDKEKIIDLVAQARRINPDVNEIQILNYVLDRVKTDAKKLRIDAEDWLKFTEKAGRETSKQVMDAEIKQTIKDRVEQTLRGLTEDSPKLQEEALRQRAKEVYPNMTPDEAYKQILKDNGDEFEEAVEKTTEIVTEATEQTIEEAAKKGVFVSKTDMVMYASIFLGALGLHAVRSSKKETSSSPWFFDDNSNISFLNGVTGRESYVKLKDLILKSDLGNRARREFLDMVYNTNSPETKSFINKMANLKKNQIPVDTLIDFSKENLEDLAIAHKENIIEKLESLVEPEKLYGSSNPRVQSNKKEAMFRIIAELFILNEGINNDLLDYLNRVIKEGDKFSTENRERSLNKIFLGWRASIAAERRFRNKLNKINSSTSPIFGTPRKTSQGGSSVADLAARELNNWPAGKTENDDDTLDFLERYLKDSRAIGKNLSKDQVKNWVETNIRNPEQGKKPYAWSAVFLRSVTKQAGQELPSEPGMLASHKGYVEAAKKNTLKPGGPDEGEWFYLPMEKPLPALGDQSLRSDGITNKSINYEPQNGDIIITTGGRDSAYHGDILTSKGRIGGNVSDAIGVRSPSKPMHGIVTNNPKAREQLLNKLTAQGIKEMSKKDIKQLVAEVLNESYAKYPYNANEYSEEEPDQDYMVEWKALVEEVCGMKRKNVDGDPKTMEDAAVEVAKLFVKDSDLFREVLEMAGSNKSIGVEILQQLKATREKKNLDKELNV